MKILVSGAAAALVSGVLLGHLMAPDLNAGSSRPAGPQMIADFAGERSTGPFDPGTTFVAYHGRTPDYVLGTDWKRALTWPDQKVAVTQPARDDATAAADDADTSDEIPALTKVAYDDAPPPAQGYPSLGGARPDTTAPEAPAEPDDPGQG